jgi:hypothetical protein
VAVGKIYHEVTGGGPFIGQGVRKSRGGWTLSHSGVGFELGFDLTRIRFCESNQFCFGDKVLDLALCYRGENDLGTLEVARCRAR